MKSLIKVLCATTGAASVASAFFVPQTRKGASRTSTLLHMAIVPPSESPVVGVVGRGYVSVLAAKLAALAGYKTWMLYPADQLEVFQKLIGDDDAVSSNLDLIDSSDLETWQASLETSDALVLAVDDFDPLDEKSVKALIASAPNMKRVVAMSRNLNGKGMGFVVKASRATANSEVWDGSSSSAYKAFEAAVKETCDSSGADYTIVRAGTLKGGACGEGNEYSQFLGSKFYEMTKKDIVKWQLLFDCGVRGVTLQKGDVMPGPGGKAILTATATDAQLGDTSRCGIAEAMIRSLAIESAANVDFGIGTADGRVPPTAEEWEKLFSVL